MLREGGKGSSAVASLHLTWSSRGGMMRDLPVEGTLVLTWRGSSMKLVTFLVVFAS